MEVTFPISIGLCGAPDSGKQKVVEEFYNLSADWFKENQSELVAIPNPGNLIEGSYNQAMGAFGSYVEDVWAFYKRYEMEQAARQSGLSLISLGTVLDNLAHCGVNMERILGGITTPETEAQYQKQQVFMTTLSILFAERFHYQFGFYLPYKTKVIIAGEDEFTNHFNQRVDQALQMIFSNFGMRIQVLDQPSYEEKAAAIFETIKRIVENGPDPLSSASLAAAGESQTFEVVTPDIMVEDAPVDDTLPE